MKSPRVVLMADAGSGIGWGHAVRQFALAEALVEQHVPTLFVTPSRTALALSWPCPSKICSSKIWPSQLDTAPIVWDLPECVWDLPESLGSVVVFDDHGIVDGIATVVDPHFGAVVRRPVAHRGFAFLGPMWAPLRQQFGDRGMQHNGNCQNSVFSYREPAAYALSQSIERYYAPSLKVHEVINAMTRAAIAFVPPSMIALECLAIGLPVVLHVPNERWQPIADAMVEAEVAIAWSGQEDDRPIERLLGSKSERHHLTDAGLSAVDGRGAERLAEWLADA